MWKDLFEEKFNTISDPIFLVGHSLWGSMILKYLAEEKPNITIAGIFLVATPYLGENGWGVDEFEIKWDFKEALKQLSHVHLYQSKNDDIVPFEHMGLYKKIFPHAIVRELEGKDHAFSKGIPELVRDIEWLSWN